MSPSAPLVSLMSPWDRRTCQVGTETSLELSREGSCGDADLELSLVGGTDEEAWLERVHRRNRKDQEPGRMLQGILEEQRNICLKTETEMRERKLRSAEPWDPGDKSQLNREVRAGGPQNVHRPWEGADACWTQPELSLWQEADTSRKELEVECGEGSGRPQQNRLLRGGVAWPGWCRTVYKLTGTEHLRC